MQPNPIYMGQSKTFWAYVKLISECRGYSKRATKDKPKQLRRYTINDLVESISGDKARAGISLANLVSNGSPTEQGQLVLDYLNYRATVIDNEVKQNLMNGAEAQALFDQLYGELSPLCYIPMNKQKGDKKHPMYLTGVVNMVTEQALGGTNFNADPGSLIVITRAEDPIRVLSRRMDGAYPNITNPKAIWEIKEYYGTTTFGSRVADGVYETLLDGLELEELRLTEGIDVKHYLIVDDFFTWYGLGRSYLCRMIDMLHMGYVDEVLFGKEVLVRWADIVCSWD